MVFHEGCCQCVMLGVVIMYCVVRGPFLTYKNTQAPHIPRYLFVVCTFLSNRIIVYPASSNVTSSVSHVLEEVTTLIASIEFKQPRELVLFVLQGGHIGQGVDTLSSSVFF